MTPDEMRDTAVDFRMRDHWYIAAEIALRLDETNRLLERVVDLLETAGEYDKAAWDEKHS